MVSSIESSCLYGLVAGTDQPPQEPVAPFSLSDLINQANLKTPKKPEFTTTSHRYLICNREEFVHLDAENYSEIDEQNMNHFMNTCSPQLKLRIKRYHETQLKDYETLQLSYSRQLVDLQTLHQSQKSAYDSALTDYKKEIVNHRIQVKTLGTIMANYFAETIITPVNSLIKTNKFTDILTCIQDQIFTNSTAEEGFLQNVLLAAVYYKKMNFITFIRVMDLVYEMLERCQNVRSAGSKLTDLYRFIFNGDSLLLQQSYDQLRSPKRPYDEVLKILKETFLDSLTKTPNIVTPTIKLNKARNTLLHQNDTNTVTRGWCDDCQKVHPLPCDGRWKKWKSHDNESNNHQESNPKQGNQ